jgi:hypothetical protein
MPGEIPLQLPYEPRGRHRRAESYLDFIRNGSQFDGTTREKGIGISGEDIGNIIHLSLVLSHERQEIVWANFTSMDLSIDARDMSLGVFRKPTPGLPEDIVIQEATKMGLTVIPHNPDAPTIIKVKAIPQDTLDPQLGDQSSLNQNR